MVVFSLTFWLTHTFRFIFLLILLHWPTYTHIYTHRLLLICIRIFDVWWGVWRCTHAKLAPLAPHPLVRDCHYGPALGQRGERFGAGNLFAPISPLLLKRADGATTLSLRFGIDQDLGILGLYGKLAAGCLRSGPAWIVFCFHCWVADGKNGGMARSGIGCWVAAAMGCPCRSRAISILYLFILKLTIEFTPKFINSYLHYSSVADPEHSFEEHNITACSKFHFNSVSQYTHPFFYTGCSLH